MFMGISEKKDGRPGQSVKKVALCTQVHDMWPFGPLVLFGLIIGWRSDPKEGVSLLRDFILLGGI